MHLLKIDESGALYDSEEAVDLAQPPGDVVILSSADTEVSLLTAAATSLQHKNADIGDIRIANYLSLTHPYRSEERRVGKECRSRWSPYH